MIHSRSLFSRVVILAFVSALAALALASCSSDARDDSRTPLELDRAYLASVNSIGTEVVQDLAGFSGYVANGDAASMKLAAQKAAEDLAAVEAITPPTNLAEAHEEYVAGAQDLSNALNSYVDIYVEATAAGESADAEALAAKVAEVQKTYQSGVDHLSAADGKVAEVLESAGASPEYAASASMGSLLSSLMGSQPSADAPSSEGSGSSAS